MMRLNFVRIILSLCRRQKTKFRLYLVLVKALKRKQMKFSSHVKPISYLKSHAAEIIQDISESREPLLITQNGEAKLVVLDVKSYEEYEETLALLKIIALGNKEIEEGKFYSADQVFSDLDKE
jgi:prevent-host-death family protein